MTPEEVSIVTAALAADAKLEVVEVTPDSATALITAGSPAYCMGFYDAILSCNIASFVSPISMRHSMFFVCCSGVVVAPERHFGLRLDAVIAGIGAKNGSSETP